MENPTQTFREVMNLVLQLIEELQIKSKTVMNVGEKKITATQSLDTKNIWHCVLTLLIRETYDFWSPLFQVFLACKHEKLLFQK